MYNRKFNGQENGNKTRQNEMRQERNAVLLMYHRQ